MSFPRPRSDVLQGEIADYPDGGWRVYFTAPGGTRTEVSNFRGFPVTIGELEDSDPFTWEAITLSFEGVTIFDRLGSGELSWLVKEADVEIEWVGDLPESYPYTSMTYEGWAEDFERTTSGGISIEVKGALHQLDHTKAKPEHPVQPIPYELAIRHLFEANPSCRVQVPVVEWPDWWTTRYQPAPNRNTAFIPSGVRPNEFWTGLVTRSTGSWDEGLTSYIQSLLGSMYTSRGRWTLELDPGRRAVLRHRDYKTQIDDGTVMLDLASPGVEVTLREDWSQTAQAYYGNGKSLQGVGYSGMSVSADGQRTSYKPLAALRQVYPTGDRNGWLQTERMCREAVLQVTEGLDQAQMTEVGQFQLRHFSEPGQVGDVMLKSDVRLASGEVISRFCVRAGMTAYAKGYNGTGILLHIAKVSRNLATGVVTLTVDSKYRDILTVTQVQTRGRDALSIPRLLIGGQYTPALADQLVPWSYAEGSGYIPGGPGFSSKRLFDGMPDEVQFPWEEWTTQRPPGKKAWRSAYIGIPPANANADNNWAYLAARGGGRYGFPIRMAQAATIRLLQIAAFDGDGNVLPVPFHVSLYSSNGVNVASMPKIPSGTVDGYPAEQHYPFFQGAWERYGSNGVQISTEVTVPVSSAGFIRGWGSGRTKAGYWPGSSGTHEPTGLLVDTETFAIQTPTGDGNGDWGINPFSARQIATYAGYLYLMVYCDAQADRSVYFAGRFFRDEPGGGE